MNSDRHITADTCTCILTEVHVCPNVLVEPTLQQLSGEPLSYRSGNVKDNAWEYVAMSDFWNYRQRSFVDVRVFNPFSSS